MFSTKKVLLFFDIFPQYSSMLDAKMISSFPLMWLIIGLSRKIRKMSTTPVSVSHPKQV